MVGAFWARVEVINNSFSWNRSWEAASRYCLCCTFKAIWLAQVYLDWNVTLWQNKWWKLFIRFTSETANLSNASASGMHRHVEVLVFVENTWIDSDSMLFHITNAISSLYSSELFFCYFWLTAPKQRDSSLCQLLHSKLFPLAPHGVYHIQ